MKSFLISLFGSVGGGVAVCLIILRFLKSRIEKYIDSKIELKNDKILAKYNAQLDKEKMYWTSFIQKELDCINLLFQTIEALQKEFLFCFKKIRDVIESEKRTSILIDDEDFMNSLNKINKNNNSLANNLTLQLFISKDLNDKIKELIFLLEKWIDSINQSLEKYNMENSEKEELEKYNKTITDSFSSIFDSMKHIKEKALNGKLRN